MLILSLGVDDPIEFEHPPQQHLEQQQQQGKLFDHINPIFYKVYFVFNLYICIASLLLNGLVKSLVAYSVGK